MVFAAHKIQHQELYMTFLDLSKAFDTVDRLTLWKILEKAGYLTKFIKMIQPLHDNMTAAVLVDGELSSGF